MEEAETREHIILTIKDLNRDDYGFGSFNDLVALGADINPVHYDKFNRHFLQITLPEGFTLGDDYLASGFKHKNLYDANGNRRGFFLVKIDNPKICNFGLLTRYGVVNKRNTKNDLTFERIYFGNDDEELFEVGRIYINTHDNSALYIESKIAELRNKCKEMADQLYPDWKSPLAYWDIDTPTLDNNPVLSRIKED